MFMDSFLAPPKIQIYNSLLTCAFRDWLYSGAQTGTLKIQLKPTLMLEWPTVCTHDIGHTNLVKHCIITTDEMPVRKRAYKVSKNKQNFIDAEVEELLARKIICPSVSPWASPVLVVQRKMVDQEFVLITGV